VKCKMPWKVKRPDAFLKHLKKHKKNSQLLLELDKKIKRLRKNPEKIGGYLSGRLHGKKSTRLTGKYRLIFNIDEDNKIVYLLAIDHRKKAY